MAWAVLLQAHKSVLDVLAAHYDWSFGVGHGVGGGNSARAPSVEHSLGRGVSASGAVRQGLSERAALRGETARWNYSVDEAPRRENLWRQDGAVNTISAARPTPILDAMRWVPPAYVMLPATASICPI